MRRGEKEREKKNWVFGFVYRFQKKGVCLHLKKKKSNLGTLKNFSWRLIIHGGTTWNHRSEVAFENSGTHKPNYRKVSPNHGKNYSVGWESSKWPSKATPDSPLVKNNSFSCLGGFTFVAKAQDNEFNNREVGNFFKRKGDTNWRQNDIRDLEGPNGHYGLVRGGGVSNLEEHLPPDRGECSIGLSTHGGRGMGKNSKPVLAFSHG